MKTKFTFLRVLLLTLGFSIGSICIASTPPTFPNTVFNITTYGGNSSSPDNAIAIQQAIDACTTAGGGIVLIPAGTYLSGPVVMKNNVNLQIAEGAILKLLAFNNAEAMSYPNSGKLNDYNDFIYGKKVKNIAVTGKGIIEGQGQAWWIAYKANKGTSNNISRPCLIRFDACSNIAIQGVTFLNAPNVHITIGKNSNNTTISDIIINTPDESPNTDGIDTWSPDITIKNCSISCGDDNIAMDSESKNITIKNCIFGTGHGCSIGSYTTNVGNILVDSCSFDGTEAAIRLKTKRDRGGNQKNFIYSNINIKNVRNPIWITSYYPKTPKTPDADSAAVITTTTPDWENITLKNITITDSKNAGTIWGLPEKAISNIVFDNVKINAESAMKIYYAQGVVFKNNSKITIKENSDAIITHSKASIEGIDTKTGKAIK